VVSAEDLMWRVPHNGNIKRDGEWHVFSGSSDYGYQLARVTLKEMENIFVTLFFQVRFLNFADDLLFQVNIWGNDSAIIIDQSGKVINLNTDYETQVECVCVGGDTYNIKLSYLSNHGSFSLGFCTKDDLMCMTNESAKIAVRGLELISTKPFGKQLPFQITLLDVGARGGPQSKWVKYILSGDVIPIFVEPEESEAESLKKSYPNALVIPYALSNKRKKGRLHITRNPGCSSLLEPNLEFLNLYSVAPAFYVNHVIEIEVYPFYELAVSESLPIIDVMKIDVQGLEYEVLQGLGDYIKNILVIELEAHFYPIYKGQKLFHNIVGFPNEAGFKLNAIRPQANFDRDIVEINAWFCQRDDDCFSEEQVEKLKFLQKHFELGINPSGAKMGELHS